MSPVRHASLLTLVVAGALLLAGCQSSDDAAPTTPATATTTATPDAPASTEPAGPTIPIAAATAPADFALDDGFARTYQRAVSSTGVTDPLPEREAGPIAQQLCSILSSGGVVSKKVDFWTGQNDYESDRYDPVLVTGIRALCPEYAEAYLADRAADRPGSDVELADLARFVEGSALGEVGVLSPLDDASIQRVGQELCETASTGSVLKTLASDPPQKKALDIALVLAYCPDLLEGF